MILTSCGALKVKVREANNAVPEYYGVDDTGDTLNSGHVSWRAFFTDQDLIALIDTALSNNQELNIVLQEIEIAKNEIGARQGEFLPKASGFIGAGVEKTPRYTRNGAIDASTEIEPGKEIPEFLSDLGFGIRANWEIDVWKKLRNAKKAAVSRYLASVQGKNFMITNLVSEIASEYYELLALDAQLANINRNINIQNDALEVVRQQKDAARVTELAVRRFEAQLLNSRSLKTDIEQQIVVVENRINFLTGRFSQPIQRQADNFDQLIPEEIHGGIPADLLDNRADIQQAELELEAQKLDVKVAKAKFYPSFGISTTVGLQSFNPKYIINPESILLSMAGDMMAPLINRKTIKAEYFSANSKQLQAVYNYEKVILNAYLEVANRLSAINNLEKSYGFKQREVEALSDAVEISNNLFKSARADYMEVLLTQRDALEAQFDLIETKKNQFNAVVGAYRALGGGWN